MQIRTPDASAVDDMSNLQRRKALETGVSRKIARIPCIIQKIGPIDLPLLNSGIIRVRGACAQGG